MTTEEHHELLSKILQTVHRIHEITMATQADLDNALATFQTALQTTVASINQKLADLQTALSAAQAAGGTPPDFSSEIASIQADTATLSTLGQAPAPAPAPTAS